MIELLYGIILNVLIFSSLMILISYNSNHAVLFLILSYISASIILIILKCEFMALILITIYVGAVAVLFLFVILMLDLKQQKLTKNLFLYSYSAILSLLFLTEVLILILNNFQLNAYFFIKPNILILNHQNLIFKLDTLLDIEVLGQILSINFVFQLLIAGLILFLGIVGAVIVALNFSLKKTKLQIFYRQFSRSFKNSLIFE